LTVASEILKGAASQVEAAGATVAGGHSIQSDETIYGLAVTGLVSPSAILTNSGAKVKDKLILTKPLGTGVALLGLKGNALSPAASQALFFNLTLLNDKALAVASQFPVSACTDVTGFGLIGHLNEMAKAANLAISLFANHVPFLPEVLKLASQGFVPAAAYGNRRSFEATATFSNNVDLAVGDLLFDPQTSGGLLLAVPPKYCQNLLESLLREGLEASCLGEFVAGEAGSIEVNAQ